MSANKDQALSLDNSSLEEVVDALLHSIPIKGADEAEKPFVLPTSDSIRSFGFYTSRRDLWRYDRMVQSKEIEELLQFMDRAYTPPPRRPTSTRTDVPVWTLIRLEAHRFAGLHRHCGFNGEDPESFILSFEKDITLIHGFNGAGKTALLSA